MARVTVEDCIEIVENRFELVVLSSIRARDIASGSPITVERDNDKNPVVALREIAERKIKIDSLRESFANNLQNNNSYRPTKFNDLSKEDEIEIETELDNYEFENSPNVNEDIDDDISFGEDDFELDE